MARQATGEVAAALRVQCGSKKSRQRSAALRSWTSHWLRTLKALRQGKRALMTLGFPADPSVSPFPRTS